VVGSILAAPVVAELDAPGNIGPELPEAVDDRVVDGLEGSEAVPHLGRKRHYGSWQFRNSTPIPAFLVAPSPLVGSLAGDPHGLGGRCHSPAVLDRPSRIAGTCSRPIHS
jgi:hypothetical protein